MTILNKLLLIKFGKQRLYFIFVLYAVAQRAELLRKNPEVIKARHTDITGVSMGFIENVNDPHYQLYIIESNIYHILCVSTKRSCEYRWSILIRHQVLLWWKYKDRNTN